MGCNKKVKLLVSKLFRGERKVRKKNGPSWIKLHKIQHRGKRIYLSKNKAV